MHSEVVEKIAWKMAQNSIMDDHEHAIDMMLVKVDNESRINNHNFKVYVIEDLGVNISETDMNLFMKGLK